MSLYIILIPLLSALVGWGTNILAVRMLFHPRGVKKIGPFRLQGVIPRRRRALAADIAETVQNQLLTPEAIKQALAGPEIADKLVSSFESRFEGFLANFLGRNPILAEILAGPKVAELKSKHKAWLKQELPQLFGRIAEPLSRNISFQQHIEQQIDDFDLSKLEEITNTVIGNELREVERLGALIGFIVGIFQLFIFFYLN